MSWKLKTRHFHRKQGALFEMIYLFPGESLLSETPKVNFRVLQGCYTLEEVSGPIFRNEFPVEKGKLETS